MTSATSPSKTVLVAADTPFVRARFKAALDVAGHRAVVVKSVAQLLAQVHADLNELDLIVLDLRMPHASGIELIQRIRKLDQGRLPILVFSGTVTSAEEVRELARAGRRGLRERIQRGRAHPAVDCSAPVPRYTNRRGRPRVVMGIPISYRVGGTIAAALTLNLSRGGIAIRTSGPLARDMALKLRFALPGSKQRTRNRSRGLLERREGRHGPAVHEHEAGGSGGD